MGSVFSGDGFQIKTQMISELMPYTCKTNLWVEVGQFFLPIMLLDMPEHCALLNYDQVSPEILVGEFMRKDGCEWLVLLETDEHHEGGVQVQGYKAVEKDIWSSNWIASRNLVAWTKQPIGGLLIHPYISISTSTRKGIYEVEYNQREAAKFWGAWSLGSATPRVTKWVDVFVHRSPTCRAGNKLYHYFMIAKQGPRSKLGHFQQTTPPTWHSQRPHRSKTIWWIHAPNAKEAPPVSPSWAGQIRWC